MRRISAVEVERHLLTTPITSEMSSRPTVGVLITPEVRSCTVGVVWDEGNRLPVQVCINSLL